MDSLNSKVAPMATPIAQLPASSSQQKSGPVNQKEAQGQSDDLTDPMIESVLNEMEKQMDQQKGGQTQTQTQTGKKEVHFNKQPPTNCSNGPNGSTCPISFKSASRTKSMFDWNTAKKAVIYTLIVFILMNPFFVSSVLKVLPASVQSLLSSQLYVSIVSLILAIIVMYFALKFVPDDL